MKAQTVFRGIDLLIHIIGSRWGRQSHAPTVLPPGTRLATTYKGGWVGLETSLDEREKLSPVTGFEPRTLQPVASCCTNYVIPATISAY
jgi:hypothetical protein